MEKILILNSISEITVASVSTVGMVQAAEAAVDAAKEVFFNASNIWMMLCTVLVFIMNLGFASVETGFSQTKNSVNILFKNVITPVIGILLYTLIGFNLMYPGFETPGWFGFSGVGLSLPEGGNTPSYAEGYTYWTDFLFQAMFAATTATIVSGAVAERIKFSAYIIFTIFFVGVVYPWLGSWHWGGGVVSSWGFHDFAGSTIVHSVGGWGALAGIILLGARKGKYVDGKVNAFPASNLALATIGVFLLWMGWFGFNGGSVLSSDPGAVSMVLVNTTIGACAGAAGAFFLALFVNKTYDFGMVLNGILAGLVGVTAGADIITATDSVIIGLIAGLLVVLSVILLDKLKLDDVVGAVPVHLICGIWGTLATGIFGEGANVIAQIKGITVYGVAAFALAFVIFAILKYTMGIRVSEEEEKEGLDKYEHGVEAYTKSI